MKWKGYHRQIWELEEFMEETATMDCFITAYLEKSHPQPV